MRISLLLTMAMIGALLTAMPGAFATTSAEDIHLQADVSTDAADKFDWEDFVERDNGGIKPIEPLSQDALDAGFIAAGASADHVLPDTTTFTQGSKDIQDVSDWACTRSNNVNNKVDITNAYSVGQMVDGDLVIYFGMEIKAPEGNSNVGMWFLQNEAECERTGGGSQKFVGSHEEGDVLVVSAFTNGGRVSNVTAYVWVGDGSGDFGQGNLDLLTEIPNAECGGEVLGDRVACAVANSDEPVSTDWFSPNRQNQDADLEPNTFFEGGINLTRAITETDNGDVDPCINYFLANTRSSQSLTATLFDYTTGELPLCGGLTVVKETDPADADQEFDFEVTGPSHPDGDSFSLNAADKDPEDLDDPGSPKSETYTDILNGSYTIDEVDIPDGWDLDDVTCTRGGTEFDTGWEEGDTSVTVDVGVSENVVCTFTNRQRGSILIEKTYTLLPDENDRAEFTLWHEDDVTFEDDDPVQPNEGGIVMDPTTITFGEGEEAEDRYFYCAEDLLVGQDYWIFETHVPTGFTGEEPFDLPAVNGTCQERLDALTDPELEAQGPQAIADNVHGSVDLVVTKYKLTLDEEGDLVRSDTVLEGFEYSLYEGHDLDSTDLPTAVDSGTTDDDGEVEFTLEPDVGDYTVCETGTPNGYWGPPEEPCQEVSATLADVGGSAKTLDFENEPLSKVEVLFYDMTGYTNAEIVCVPADGEENETVGTPIEPGGEEGDPDSGVLLDHLPLGDYDCELQIRNGGNGNGGDEE